MRPARKSCTRSPITIFGGLVTATLLDTLLTPTLFLRYGRKPLERLVAQARAASGQHAGYADCVTITIEAF